jgi:carbonic anhydrase/acetyltransferase-like protein (isoleucine patch superfamily)
MNASAPTVVLGIDGQQPDLDTDAWAAPGSCLIGGVYLASKASVWYGAVLRADNETIRVGTGTNIQDGCVLHADPGFPASLGTGVTVGHRAVLHGCTVENDCLIGMGAVVLNGAVIGAGSLLAAGTVVLEGATILPGSLVAGIPGKVRREVTDEEKTRIRLAASRYMDNATRHRLALNQS